MHDLKAVKTALKAVETELKSLQQEMKNNNAKLRSKRLSHAERMALYDKGIVLAQRMVELTVGAMNGSKPYRPLTVEVE